MSILIRALFFAIVLASFLHGQTPPDWDPLISKNGELRLSMPKDRVVIRENEKITIDAAEAGVSFKLVKQVFDDPKGYVERIKFEKSNPVAKDQQTRGSFLIKRFDFVNEGSGYSVYLYAGSKKVYYSISILAGGPSDPLLAHFLNSIKFDGEVLTASSQKPTNPAAGLVLEELKTSDSVRAQLEKVCSDKIHYGYAPTGQKKFTDNKVYSRRLIIITMPAARPQLISYTSRGSVVLRLLFGADGCIHSALVISGSSDKTHTYEALKAAMKIRFLPAQIDGKAVDSYKDVEYIL